ncbi:MAG: NAD(P)H-hydrate epimerase, partial [Clostridia bacterium]
MYLATPSQMKAAEANAVAAGETYIGLMENAGAAAVQELCRCVDINADSRVLIICGRGNNGGDGWVAGEYLDRWG